MIEKIITKIKRSMHRGSLALKRLGHYVLKRMEKDTFFGWFILIVVFVLYISVIFIAFYITVVVFLKRAIDIWNRWLG